MSDARVLPDSDAARALFRSVIYLVLEVHVAGRKVARAEIEEGRICGNQAGVHDVVYLNTKGALVMGVMLFRNYRLF